MSFNFEFVDGAEVPEDLWLDTPIGTGLNPVFHNIVWATLATGVNFIKTEAEADKLWRRQVMMDMATGFETTIKLEDVRRAVGLSTNAPALTDAAFKAKVYKALNEQAGRRLEREQKREGDRAS